MGSDFAYQPDEFVNYEATPPPGALGHQAALECGRALVDVGASDRAIPYLQRAVALRPISYAYTLLGKCFRDLGRLSDAETAFRMGLDAPGADSGHSLCGLVAVLCDQRNYQAALELATKLLHEHPNSPAALETYARVLWEFADTLGRSPEMDQGSVEQVKAQADALRKRARGLDGVTPKVRREQWRTFAFHMVTSGGRRDPESIVSDNLVEARSSRNQAQAQAQPFADGVAPTRPATRSWFRSLMSWLAAKTSHRSAD